MIFEGFTPPTKNYFPMPNEWINICAQIDNLAELKVIQYVLRHTWGYQEFGITKAITIDEFMRGRKRQDGTRIDNGTGLKSDRSVKDGLKAAIEHGYLIYDVDDTDKARIKKSYALKMSSELGQVDTTPQDSQNRGVVSTPLTGSIYPSGVQNLPPNKVVSTPRTEKDTIERQGGIATSAEDRNAHPLINLEMKRVEKRETNPRMPAINLKGQTDHGTSHSSPGDSGVPGGLREDLHRIRGGDTPLIEQKPGASPLPSAATRSDGHGDASAQASSQHPLSTQGLPAPAASTELPQVSVQQGAMAMTPRQIKAQAERREKELWAIIEAERGTTYTTRQRALHKEGIALLIADDISDEVVIKGLRSLSDFERKSFTVLKFYGWLPNLSAKAPTPMTNGVAPRKNFTGMGRMLKAN